MKKIEATAAITTLIIFLLATIAAATTSAITTTVYAQTPTAPPSTTTSEIPLSAAAQQIIADAQTGCSRETGLVAPSLCISVIHESPSTVVLNGQLLVSEGATGYVDNPFIWRAVDGFRGQGYTLSSTELSGQGSQGNPHQWFIVMSK